MLETHELATIIPPMTDAEYAELREDIQKNGQLEAITLYQGQVLDGRHRAKACAEIGIEPWTREYHGTTPAEYVIALNVHRRQLTTGQKAEIARRALPALRAEAKTRQAAHVSTADRDEHGHVLPSGGQSSTSRKTSSKSRDVAGALVGVSGKTVERLDQVAEARPDLHQQVKAGDMTVNAAYESMTGRSTKGSTEPQDADKVVQIDLTKTRNRQQAEASKLRVEKAVGSCNGLARGLDSLNVRYAASVASAEEIHGWDQSFSDAIAALRRLRKQLQQEAQPNAA